MSLRMAFYHLVLQATVARQTDTGMHAISFSCSQGLSTLASLVLSQILSSTDIAFGGISLFCLPNVVTDMELRVVDDVSGDALLLDRQDFKTTKDSHTMMLLFHRLSKD